MNSILAEQGVRLSYTRDPSRSEAFDPGRILDDLYGEGTARAMLPWQNGLRMAASDHLVVATESSSGRCLGVIAASDRATEREPFLFLDAAYIAPLAGASFLLQRMLAFAMLRIGGPDPVPGIIAACVHTPFYAGTLRGFARWFGGASLFPAAPEDIVIDLGMASLARRIVRVVRSGSRYEAANGSFRGGMPAGAGGAQAEVLVVVDLTAADETAVVGDARRLYRARPQRGPRYGDETSLEDVAAASVLRDASAV
ncbi:MAG TPA: hypothetical protein VMB73_30295 [Acetobacteraceae bacterium]|nr:hypothetical protein [Acetobacteraceae bacterium]